MANTSIQANPNQFYLGNLGKYGNHMIQFVQAYGHTPFQGMMEAMGLIFGSHGKHLRSYGEHSIWRYGSHADHFNPVPTIPVIKPMKPF